MIEGVPGASCRAGNTPRRINRSNVILCTASIAECRSRCVAIDGLLGQGFDHALHIGRRGPAMLTRLAADDFGAGVITSAPMQCQLDALGIQDAYDDLHEQAAQDAFARFRPCRGMGPRPFEVLAERHEPLSLGGG
jgi:hypothetical protein